MFNIQGQLQGIPARYANSTSNSGFYSLGRNVDNIGPCISVNVAKSLIREVLQSYGGANADIATSDDGAAKDRIRARIKDRFDAEGIIMPHWSGHDFRCVSNND